MLLLSRDSKWLLVPVNHQGRAAPCQMAILANGTETCQDLLLFCYNGTAFGSTTTAATTKYEYYVTYRSCSLAPPDLGGYVIGTHSQVPCLPCRHLLNY